MEGGKKQGRNGKGGRRRGRNVRWGGGDKERTEWKVGRGGWKISVKLN